jgi:hypothetical protein
MSGAVLAFALYDDGRGPRSYAGGEFNAAGGAPAGRIARWDGTSWSELGGGLTRGASRRVTAMTAFDDGSGEALYVARPVRQGRHLQRARGGSRAGTARAGPRSTAASSVR